MPSFDVDFEVYCATCNAGLCNSTETGKTKSRRELFIKVEACSSCMDEKDQIISDLKNEIKELESRCE